MEMLNFIFIKIRFSDRTKKSPHRYSGMFIRVERKTTFYPLGKRWPRFRSLKAHILVSENRRGWIPQINRGKSSLPLLSLMYSVSCGTDGVPELIGVTFTWYRDGNAAQTPLKHSQVDTYNEHWHRA